MSLLLDPSAFLRSAKEHAEAARVLYEQQIWTSIFCYLTCTAAEMYGKFILSAKGETSEDLKDKYGHNVFRIYTEIRSFQKDDPLRPSDADIIDILPCGTPSADIGYAAGANAFKYPYGNPEKWPQDWLTETMISEVYEKSLSALERLISQAESASGQQS